MDQAVHPISTRTGLSLGVLAAFAGIYVIWGTTYLAIAFAIKSLPPFMSGVARFGLAGLLMYVWLRWRNPRPFAGVNVPMMALAGILLSGIGNGLVLFAQQGIPSGIAALIVAAVPVLVLIFDWAFFSKRAPTKQALLGTAVAIAGVVTIVMHTRSLSGNAHPLYLLAMVVAATGWSLGTLVQKRSANTGTVLSFTCGQMLFGAAFQLLMSFVTGEWLRFDPAAISLQGVVAIAYLVVFGSIVGLNCYLWLLTRVAAPKVATYALVNPVVAMFLGAVVLGERVTLLAVVAALLVLVGVALIVFQDLPLVRTLTARSRR
ncbi:MAG TPA: EamA family transporter [Steroidobacteraceae bacterium]|jgi:drug/metabolite transporter (DMT)-like permease|nr:EamA family transporter [Steroidobacteraceae bacterium]HJY38535.1 EamA family transporter [Steroidobacteraceae bacterium]HJY42408.1 EamA family transporter [Steroidobacteraceae bacterium]